MDTNTSNKRIAKNTIFLYIRMLIIMLVTLYTSRVVLEALGVDDFGIYNVVGGLSSFFIFFQSALTNSTQRFLSYEHGTGNNNRLNNIFNLSLAIFSSIAIFILIIGTIFGTWFIRTKLNIPSQTLNAACIVLYMTLLSLLFSFVGSVFDSVIIARENMKIYAYLGIIDAIGRLACAYIITQIPENKLSIYAILLAIVHILPKIGLIIYCRIKYSETTFRPYWDRELFHGLFGFAGWNIYGTGVWMINQQGINILLNIYFGPVVNAARGIAAQVTSAISNLSVNFFTAVRPQMIKSYAAHDYNKYLGLIYSSTKYSVYLIWLICLPLWFKCEPILTLWLKTVPDYTIIFVKWVIVFVVIDTLNNPLWCAIQAVGNLKKTILYGSTFYLLAFPISYIFLHFGAEAWCVYPILTLFRIGYIIIVFHILMKYTSLNVHNYIRLAILPSLLVIIATYCLGYYINSYFNDSFFNIILFGLLTTLIIGIAIYFLGLNKSEKALILSKINIKRFIH